MKIIDAHTHVDEVGAWQDPPEVIVRLMDEAAIEQAVVMTYRDAPAIQSAPDLLDPIEYTRRAVERYPERLIGFARINPRAGDEADRLLRLAVLEYGMKGLKLHPVAYRALPDGPDTLRLLRLAGDLGVPALFHCGDEEFTLPLQIELAAALCPQTVIILGHMGGYFHVQDAIAAAERQSNIILETSAMPYPWRIAEAVQRIGAERVLYASDGPGCDPSLEVAKVRRAGLRDADLELVFHGTIERLLRLSP
ncbi:MAG: amidohydrolase family protein [Dehalococcoidia bacterium]